MASPSHHRSTLRAPLDEILGTEVNVRIIRLLTRATAPMLKAGIARGTSLNESGVGRAVAELTRLDVLEPVGAGSRRPYRIRSQHPLAAPLASLFAAEQTRFEAIVNDLTAAVRRLTPAPLAAWIQGPVARESDAPGDPVIVGMLTATDRVDATAEQLRDDLRALERDHGITIRVQGLTSADLANLPAARRKDLKTTIPLLGPPPLLESSAAPDLDQLPRERIADLCRKYRIRRLAVFGSALREDFAPGSDVDILVEFEPGARVGLAFFAIQEELSKLFGRKVDLNTEHFLSKYFRDEVLAEARDIYVAA